MPIGNQFFILLLFFSSSCSDQIGMFGHPQNTPTKRFFAKVLNNYIQNPSHKLAYFIYILFYCSMLHRCPCNPLSPYIIFSTYLCSTQQQNSPRSRSSRLLFSSVFLSLRHFLYKSNVNNIMIRLSSINQTITAVFQIQFFYVSSVSPVVSSSTLINSMAQKFSFCGSCKKIIKTNY